MNVTGLLLAWRAGDEAALDQLMPLVHDELHRIARRCMHGERAGHSLQATALVNEAYLRLLDVQQVNWQNRAHFLAMSARLMRRILVDFARAKRNQKRGGDAVRVTFIEDLAVSNEPAVDLVELHDALDTLAAFVPPAVVQAVIRPIARFMFKRVLRNAAFPNGFKAQKALNPASGPATPAEGRVRLETAHQRFDEACRRVAAGGRPMVTLFGSVPVQDLVRFSELHTRHHTKQMAARQ
jgi:RNA polymerase sigma factor (TIGR02999 family)